MKSSRDILNRMANAISAGNTETSSTGDDGHGGDPYEGDGRPCALCGKEPLCGGLGMVRYNVPIEDSRFGKLFRCPNYPAERDTVRLERLRKLSNLGAYAEKSFEDFAHDSSIHSPSEQQSLYMAYKRARAFADHPDGWLVLEGTYGCGKTHLAAAIGNTCLERGRSVLFITTPDLLDHLRSTYAPSAELTYDETFDRVRNTDILILDDLGVENPSHWAQEKLFQLLNHRYVNRLPTVITTNANIDQLDARIRSRLLDLSSTSRVVISAPDFRSLRQNEREQLASSLSMYEHMTFANFDTQTDANAEERENLHRVYQAARSYAAQPSRMWLILLGGYGSGKTHLAAAIAHDRESRGDEVMFITVPDLMDYLRNTYNPDATMSFDQRFNKVKAVPFLVLDDLGSGGSQWAQEKLFQIVDYRYILRLPTVFTTAKAFEELSERIRTRIMDDRLCVPYALTGRSYVMRRRRR